MVGSLLNVRHGLSGFALVPGSIQIFRGIAKLDDEVVREILRRDLATLFSPKPNDIVFVLSHDDAGVRSADEVLAIVWGVFNNRKRGQMRRVGLSILHGYLR